TATTRPSTDRSAQNARRDEPAKQVLNPRSDALADQTSGANDTPEPAAGKVPGPDRVAQAANRDGLPIREGDDVGLAAGMSEDGRTSVHDAAMPRWYDDARGRRFDLRESRDYHERVEKALLDAGHTYPEAHRAATEVEHARMRQMGFDPNAVEAFQQPYIDHAAHRARAEGSTTPDVTAEPYIDSGELGMRRDAPADPRFVLDREGKRYDQPVHGKLLDSIETVTGRDGDGGYAVMDPHSGKVLKRGSTFELARMRAERMASNLGRRRLQERLDAEPALSQQQLRERFRNRQAEVRFSRAADTPPGRDRPPPDEQSEMQDNAPPSEGRIVSEGKDQSGITGSTEAATAEARSSTWPIIESWTKELAKNPTAYSVLHEVQLDPADYGKSRKVHKLIANKALDDYLQQSGAPEKHLEALIPDIRESVSPEGRRKTPEGWIWEHASTSTTSGRKGVMRLVPDYQHTPKSSWWRTLHPDKGARGGYSEWAIPSGAPPNKSKKK
uniref:hypothetical protein n=1 Tax=Nevskia soli TaxID=418856 RepID=UPI00055D6960